MTQSSPKETSKPARLNWYQRAKIQAAKGNRKAIKLLKEFNEKARQRKKLAYHTLVAKAAAGDPIAIQKLNKIKKDTHSRIVKGPKKHYSPFHPAARAFHEELLKKAHEK